jgi:iron complex transport system ATP-binding protein
MGGGKIIAAGKPEEVLTTQNISKTYGVEVSIKRHPLTGSLYTMPISTSAKAATAQGKGEVHVICGGGTGAEAMRRLVQSGWHVSAGVLNMLDTDYESAEILKVQIISEAPFSNISDDASQQNLQRIENVAALIVTDFPVGYGNLKNLEAALFTVQKGLPTIMIKGSPISERDFTKGEATTYYKRIVDAGALVAETVDEVLKILERYAKQDRI